MIRFIYFLITTVVLAFSAMSCAKQDTDLGLPFLPQDDLLAGYIDSTSITVSVQTVREDSLRSSKITYMLGSMNAGEAGAVRAEFFTRMYFSNLSVNLSTFSLDSICVEMQERSQFIGDTLIAQTIKLYELTQDITLADFTEYYKTLSVPSHLINSAVLITEKQHTPRLAASSKFRCKLPSAYAQDMYARIKNTYTQSLDLQSVDSAFAKVFKGLYVTTGYENAAIVNYAPQINVYLRSADSSYVMVLAPSASSFKETSVKDPSRVYLQSLNVFAHEYSTAFEEDFGFDASYSYVQGFAGLKTKFSLIGLDSWKDSVIVNNSMKLILPRAAVSQTTFAPIVPLQLQVYNPNNALVFTILSTVSDSAQYVFNINPFLSYFFKNSYASQDYTFQIVMPDENVYGNLIKFDASLPNQVRVKLSYSK